MPVPLLSARSMTDMVNNIKPAPLFILDLVFKNHKQHYTDTVDIPVLEGKQRLAKPSRRTSPAGVVIKDGKQIKTMKLPHFREKMLSTAAAALELSSKDGGIYRDKSQMEAHKLELAENLQILKDRMRTAMEFMACQALKGTVTMTGKDIAFTVDYGFDSTHLPTKTGTAVWNGATANIPADIRTWKRRVLKACGRNPTIGILGSAAYEAFIQDEKVMKALNNLNYKVGSVDLTGDSNFVGRVFGIDWYTYENTYIDDNDAEQSMYSENDVTLIAPSTSFATHFAAVADLEAGLNPVEFFSKTKPEDDPSGMWVIAETNPLPAVSNPNEILTATVL